MSESNTSPQPLSDDPLDASSRPDVPRVHSQDPAEGADPDADAQPGVEGDVPRVHSEDTAEG